jgi:hypothetical protein
VSGPQLSSLTRTVTLTVIGEYWGHYQCQVSGPQHTSLTRTVTLTVIGEYVGRLPVSSIRITANLTHYRTVTLTVISEYGGHYQCQVSGPHHTSLTRTVTLTIIGKYWGLRAM